MSAAEPISFISEGIEVHGSLFAADEPRKGTVLFCHGAFDTQKSWFDYAQRLCADGFTSLTFDFAGHGQSAGQRGMVDLCAWAYNIRDALALLDSRGFSTAGLVGWDCGGSAVVLAAAHDPHASCAVTLSAPVYLMPTLAERVAYGLASAAAGIKQAIVHKPLTLSRLNEMKNLGILSDREANQAYFSDPEIQEIFKAVPIPQSLDSVWMDITGAAKKVTIPTLVIHGAEDKIVSPGQAQKLYNLLPGQRDYKKVEGCGHALHLDLKKDTVYQFILKWMKANLPD